MSGIFAEHQAEYEEAGLPTFPVKFVAQGDNKWSKKPAVINWQKIGAPASRAFARKFPDADAFGFPLRKVTILDVDCADGRVLEDALSRHGDTKLIVKTASGFHAYYRRNGERRKVRAWGDDLPIDLLGGDPQHPGFAVAAPSKCPKGDYQIIRGGLADIADLPKMRGLTPELYIIVGTDHAKQAAPAPEQGEIIPDGKRNDSLWRLCMRQAHHVDGFDSLLDYARIANQSCSPPLSQGEVVKIASSAWEITERGVNTYDAGARAAVLNTVIDELVSDPFACTLLLALKRYHGGRESFALAQETATKFGWTVPMFRAARDALVAAGQLRCIRPGRRGSHRPALYGWPESKIKW
jgi:hypothetical protein